MDYDDFDWVTSEASTDWLAQADAHRDQERNK